MQEQGFDPEGDAFTLALAREAAGASCPDRFLAKQRAFETRREQFDQRLKALQMFAKRFEKLLQKYRRDKPGELKALAAEKLKECEALQDQPGAGSADTAESLESIKQQLFALAKVSARNHTKPKRKGRPSFGLKTPSSL